ncbi:hypothetical protein ETB97_010063 [Aspergillus alliaceus]|uniref:Alcohol dehydrogenase-like N-terminal domain-containing protein n=1 Tax=Petromyces alliaceus TaxID=209559 RepID=A0A8H6E8I2_PETAA|nr:hypothetical protein ETB97_010063 [Aspergillus burnettii]
MSTPTNAAAWLTTAEGYPFEVKEAPVWKPEENEILIRNHAVAINLVDDVAGEVIAVGPNVAHFKPGDRVVANTVGMATKRNQDNAFQNYTILQDTFLKLQLPTKPSNQHTGKTLLVCGGASSNAIQLDVAARYEVIATASAKNFDYVKKLGSSQVFVYHSPTVGEDLIQVLRGKTLAGAMDCIGFSATPICMDVVHKSEGNKSVITVKGGFPTPPVGVSVKNVFGTTIKDKFLNKGSDEARWSIVVPLVLVKHCDETRPACKITLGLPLQPPLGSLARKCSLPARDPAPGTDALPDDAHPKEVTGEVVEESGLRAFFYDYCVVSTHRSLSRGFFHKLGGMVRFTGFRSDLAKACKVVEFGGHGLKLN